MQDFRANEAETVSGQVRRSDIGYAAKVRQQLGAFLLRHGRHWSRSCWTRAHFTAAGGKGSSACPHPTAAVCRGFYLRSNSPPLGSLGKSGCRGAVCVWSWRHLKPVPGRVQRASAEKALFVQGWNDGGDSLKVPVVVQQDQPGFNGTLCNQTVGGGARGDMALPATHVNSGGGCIRSDRLFNCWRRRWNSAGLSSSGSLCIAGSKRFQTMFRMPCMSAAPLVMATTASCSGRTRANWDEAH